MPTLCAGTPESLADADLLQVSIDRLTDAIARLRLNVTIDDDFRVLRRYLTSQGAYDNPSFDPDEHDLTRDAFWIRIETSSGQIVASHAERIYHCDDFVTEIIATDRIWFDAGVPVPTSEWRTAVHFPPVRIDGAIGFAGGMYVQPPFRGSGLAVYLPYLSRSLCLKNFSTNWHTGLVRQNIAASPVPTQYYGYPRMTHLFDGTIPRTTGEFKDLHLCWMSRTESFERLRNLPTHPRYPVYLETREPRVALH